MGAARASRPARREHDTGEGEGGGGRPRGTPCEGGRCQWWFSARSRQPGPGSIGVLDSSHPCGARALAWSPRIRTCVHFRSQLRIVPPGAPPRRRRRHRCAGIGVLHERGDHRSGLSVRAPSRTSAPARRHSRAASAPSRRAARRHAREPRTGRRGQHRSRPHVVARAGARTHTHTHTHTARSERTSLPPRAVDVAEPEQTPRVEHAVVLGDEPPRTRRAARASASSSLAASAHLDARRLGARRGGGRRQRGGLGGRGVGLVHGCARGGNCARTRERCREGVGMRLRGCVSGRQPDDASKLARAYVRVHMRVCAVSARTARPLRARATTPTLETSRAARLGRLI